MKRFKLVSAVVLIMVLGFTGFNQEQKNTRKTTFVFADPIHRIAPILPEAFF
jgi:hypothetical protein